MASENMRKPAVVAALAALHEQEQRGTIATLRERKELMTGIMREKLPGPYPAQLAIAASDQLNRMERVYDDRVPSGDTYNTVVLQGYSLADLEAMLAAIKAQGDEKAAWMPTASGPTESVE